MAQERVKEAQKDLSEATREFEYYSKEAKKEVEFYSSYDCGTQAKTAMTLTLKGYPIQHK